MIEEIKQKKADFAELCEAYRVRRLELFGSAAGDDFNPLVSDLDFLVEFFPIPSGGRADAYFGLLEGLELLFGRPVDLVMVRAIKNRYFLEAIAPSRVILYAA